MNYDRLEYSLSANDWESVAEEMKKIVDKISLECFEQMLKEGKISRSKWIVIFLNTGLCGESEKYELMFKSILRQTWNDVGEDLRWSLMSAILSFNDYNFVNSAGQFDPECLTRAVDFISQYLGVPKAEVVRVIESPDKLTSDLVIAKLTIRQ